MPSKKQLKIYKDKRRSVKTFVIKIIFKYFIDHTTKYALMIFFLPRTIKLTHKEKS